MLGALGGGICGGDDAHRRESWGEVVLSRIALATAREVNPTLLSRHLPRLTPIEITERHKMTDAGQKLQQLTDEFQAIGKGKRSVESEAGW